MRFSVKRPASPSPSITAEAARWMARRDRGLTAAEQDSYLQWLADDRAHPPAILHLERLWDGLNAVRRWPMPAGTDAEGRYDAMAARRIRWRLWWQAAAAIGVGLAGFFFVLAW